MKLVAAFHPQTMRVDFTSPSVGVSTGNQIARDYVGCEPYVGNYEVTPTTEDQILHTNNFRMTRDLTVKAIPNNYGLITWDGTTITVS